MIDVLVSMLSGFGCGVSVGYALRRRAARRLIKNAFHQGFVFGLRCRKKDIPVEVMRERIRLDFEDPDGSKLNRSLEVVVGPPNQGGAQDSTAS